jgi:hypothetical protein
MHSPLTRLDDNSSAAHVIYEAGASVFSKARRKEQPREGIMESE